MTRHIGKYVVILLAFGLVAAGTAGAAKMITGKSVKNGSLTRADIKKGSLSADRLSASARASLRGQTGPQGPQGAQGVPGAPGAKGDAGAQGPAGTADRFALVGASGAVQQDLSKDMASADVTRPETGIYCFNFPDDQVPDIAVANSQVPSVIATVFTSKVAPIPQCPGAEWRIVMHSTETDALTNQPFWVLFDRK
jgi:hypothetical protein